jgi:hypothetical protein
VARLLVCQAHVQKKCCKHTLLLFGGNKAFLHPFTVQMCLICDSQNASRHEAKNKFGNLRLFEKMSFCRFIVLEYFETKALLSTVSFISNVAAAIGTNNILRFIKNFFASNVVSIPLNLFFCQFIQISQNIFYLAFSFLPISVFLISLLL